MSPGPPYLKAVPRSQPKVTPILETTIDLSRLVQSFLLPWGLEVIRHVSRDDTDIAKFSSRRNFQCSTNLESRSLVTSISVKLSAEDDGGKQEKLEEEKTFKVYEKKVFIENIERGEYLGLLQRT